jgi:hypothetical protein
MVFNIRDIFSAFGYTLSLPERLVRSLAATLGGASKILRKSQTYTAIVGNGQRFFIEKIAEVQGAYAEQTGTKLPEDYVQRAIAGNLINTVGILSIHLSPLWVFAIATDVAKGSKVYLNRLVDELKTQKVLPPDAQVKGLDDLLDSLGKAGQDTAQVFDIPPVDVSQARELRDRLLGGYANVFREATDLLPKIDAIWEKMESLAKRDNVSVDQIVGLMTVDLNRVAGKAMDAAFVVGSVTTDFLADNILKSYGETITKVQNQGIAACLDEATRPYIDAISAHLSAGKQTWTERAFSKVFGPLLGNSTDSVKPT